MYQEEKEKQSTSSKGANKKVIPCTSVFVKWQTFYRQGFVSNTFQDQSKKKIDNILDGSSKPTELTRYKKKIRKV